MIIIDAYNNIDLRPFRYFVAVAGELHFSRAARQLGRSGIVMRAKVEAISKRSRLLQIISDDAAARRKEKISRRNLESMAPRAPMATIAKLALMTPLQRRVPRKR